MDIEFSITGQTLKRLDNNLIAANSQVFLKAVFTLDDSWDGYTLTGVFTIGSTPYHVLLGPDATYTELSSNECYVPPEVIQAGYFAVSLIGVSGTTTVSRATANKVYIKVEESGELTTDAATSLTPTLADQLTAKITTAQEAASAAEAGISMYTISDSATLTIFAAAVDGAPLKIGYALCTTTFTVGADTFTEGCFYKCDKNDGTVYTELLQTIGKGIVSVVQTAGTGEAGTTDTYTITYDDATTKTYNVKNGADGVSATYYLDGSTSIPKALGGNLFDRGSANFHEGQYRKYNTVTQTVDTITDAAYCYFTLAVKPKSFVCLASTNGTTAFMPENNAAKGVVLDSGGAYIQDLGTSGYRGVSSIPGVNKRMFMMPANVDTTTIEINFMTSQKDYILMFRESSSVAYDNKITNLWFDKTVARKTDSPFIYNILDTLNTFTFMDGFYVTSTGSFSANTTFGFVCLAVTSGEVYEYDKFLPAGTASLAAEVGFFDTNKAWISKLGDGAQPLTVTIPANACYAVFNYMYEVKANITLKRISVPTEDVSIREAAVGTNGWSGLKWVSFGDSITFQNLWQPYIYNKLGLVHTNCGIGSTCVAGTESAELPKFWQDVRLQAVKDAVPDVVTILGGANDNSNSFNHIIGMDAEFDLDLMNKDTDNFKGAYSYIIEDLLTWKPTLKIIILTTTFAYLNVPNTTTGLTYEHFANASKEVAEHYGLPCVDLYHEMGLNKLTQGTLLANDGIHPNAAGAKKIAELVLAKFKQINPL